MPKKSAGNCAGAFFEDPDMGEDPAGASIFRKRLLQAPRGNSASPVPLGNYQVPKFPHSFSAIFLRIAQIIEEAGLLARPFFTSCLLLASYFLLPTDFLLLLPHLKTHLLNFYSGFESIR
jgi:hypothetical protein